MEDHATPAPRFANVPYWVAGLLGVVILVALGALRNGGGEQGPASMRNREATLRTRVRGNHLGAALARVDPARDSSVDEGTNNPDDPSASFVGVEEVPANPASHSHLQIALESGSASWEARLDALLSEPGSEESKAAALIGLLPELPPEAYDRASREIAARVPDHQYAKMILPLLLNDQTHGAIVAELYDDLTERPYEVAISALAVLARSPAHPFSETARQTLDLLVKRNSGTNE